MKIKTAGTQKESKNITPEQVTEQKPVETLQYHVTFDTTKPVETIQNFIGDINNMLNRYDQNTGRIREIEQQIIDLEHFIEISENKSAPIGYKLYKKLADLRRERRACKNENELLQPVKDHFAQNDIIAKLSRVRNDCRGRWFAMEGRTYQVRTDVLNEWLPPKDIDLDKDLSGDLDIPEV